MARSKGHMVLIHGAFCTGWAMSRWAERFAAQGWTCHAPTLRHHGDPAAERELGRTSVADFSADLTEFIKALPEAPVIVGHSMGGLLAQILGARGLARAVVGLAPSPPWSLIPSTLTEALSAFGVGMSRAMFWNQAIPPSYPIAARYTLDRLPRDERKEVFAHFVPESGRAICEVAHPLTDLKRSTAVDPLALTCPLLGLAGGADKINSARTVARIVARYNRAARADFFEYPQASHWLLSEPGWAEMADRVAGWLDEAAGQP